MWTQCNEQSRYGAVIYNFWQTGPHRLKLSVGDTVFISSEIKDWYYGHNTKNRHEWGVFPKNFVKIKEAIISRTGNYETVLPKESPIVQEITSVLREWGAIWKQLYISSNRTELSGFEVVWKMMRELIDWRRLVMSRKLTNDEMRELQQKVTNKIDMGNALLGLDLVVRDDQGNILDPLQTSTIKLFRQHKLAMQRIQDEKDSLTERQAHRKTTSFSLFVNVKNFVCRIGEDADVLMALYDVKQAQFISENYILKWGNQGMPRDIEMFNNLRALFTDMGVKDLEREKIALVCQIVRIGRMDLKDTVTKKQTNGIRRPFGVAAFDVTDIIKGILEPDEEKQFFVPFLQCGERDCLENVIKKIVLPKEINHKGQGLWVTMKKLYGDLKQVQKEYPHLIAGTTAVARKMGFPDVIMPGDVRNDIYITLLQGEFKRGGKTSDKNVEVTMCVCDDKGEVLQEVVSEGAGGCMLGTYKSVVYYHEDKPRWAETVKVAIPIDQFYGSHLRFTYKHRSSNDAKDRADRPFSMSFVKLMQDNGTTLGDTIHDLLVYKIEGKKCESSSIYLKLPSTRSELENRTHQNAPLSKYPITGGSLTLSTNDGFQITTLVCSTKLTHNVDLMGLLKWRDNPAGLQQHLLSFMKVDGEEVVKFLQDTLDALFNILMQNSDSDVYDNLVFNCLVFIIVLISDRKYHQFRPVLDVYIKENFSATLAYNKLMVVLKDYIDKVNEKRQHEFLLKAMKSLEYIFKFIIRSRILFAALNDNRGKEQFEISLRKVFDSLNVLMNENSDASLVIQGAALRYFPTTINDVITVFDPQQYSVIVIEFINSLPQDRLTKQKMYCIKDIIHSSIFKIPASRKILLPVLLSHIKSLLERQEEREVCVDVLSDMMDLLHSDEMQCSSEDLNSIGLWVLRTVIQTIIPMDRNSPLIGSCVAVMTSVLRQMSDVHYIQYIDHFHTTIDLMDFLMEILMTFKDLVSNNVFPPDWNDMIMLQNSVFLKALRHFAHTIQDRFSSPFEIEVWKTFFHCAISFLIQPALQLENFSSSKRQKIISRYKDMRRETGFEIRAMWFNLGHHKTDFIPDIVGPVLEMTLIPETELRKATIPMFFDMMQCEFMSVPKGSARKFKGDFRRFENEIITKLDSLVEEGKGDEHYKDLFYTLMSNLFEQHSIMKREGLSFVETIKELLQRLLEYRSILNDESKDNRMSCTVNLLNFYHDINRQEMYIRYVHKLRDLHLESDNYTEAAYTVMLYAKLLHWSDDILPGMLKTSQISDAETHRDLKEHLYYTMIEYFDKGKMWEKGIEMCKELAHQYESETFDYNQLSVILKKQADFYDCILQQMRPEPEYYRVSYFGQGFPGFLQNKTFIYRGKEYERLSDFTARLQNLFPNAQLLKTLNVPGEDITQSSHQYLQINAVTPILERKPKFARKKVQDSILKYYKVNEVQKFTFSKKKDESQNDVTKMWLERTNLVTSYPLPGILRWFPVTSTHTFEVSPLENATESLESVNQKLKSLIDQHRGEPHLRVDPLGMVLNGVVDAAVNGGIANYRVFYSEEYRISNNNEEHQQFIKRLKQATTLQLVLLQTGLDVHEKKAPEALQPFHAHMEQRFAQMKQFVEKEYGIKITDDIRRRLAPGGASVKRIHTMPAARLSQSSLSSTNSESSFASSAGRVAQSMHVGTTNSLSPALLNHRDPSPTKNLKESAGKTPRESPSKTVFGRIRSNTSPRPLELVSQCEVKENSHSTSSSTLSLGRRSSQGSMVIELSEQITPARPLRPESNRKSRPISGSFSRQLSLPSSRTIDIDGPETTPSSPDDEEPPPPLPEKHIYADYSNIFTNDEVPLIPDRASTLPRSLTHREKPQPPLPTSSPGEAPPPPPKKTLSKHHEL